MIKIGDVATSIRTFEGHRCDQFTTRGGQMKMASSHIHTPTKSLDISWLPLAAEKYNISDNVKDYVIAEVPIVSADVPNRNLDCFPFEELSSFNVEYGDLTYRSFIGKPCYVDHENKDPVKARGVHFDASMQKLADGRYKVVVLTGWDRTKDPALVAEMLAGKRNGFSMGAIVQKTACSFPDCGAESGNGRIACKHMNFGKGKGSIVEGNLIYELCVKGVTFFETSNVFSPADHTAVGRWTKSWI